MYKKIWMPLVLGAAVGLTSTLLTGAVAGAADQVQATMYGGTQASNVAQNNDLKAMPVMAPSGTDKVNRVVPVSSRAAEVDSSTKGMASAVVGMKQEDGNLKLSYPLVYVPNEAAQLRMNTAIADYVVKMRDLYYNQNMYQVVMAYKVTYEDDNLLSLTISSGWYNGQSAHGYNQTQGLVFNKHTGERIPATYYVHIKDNEQLKQLIASGTVNVYSQDMKFMPVKSLFGLDDVEVRNDNYILLGNGNIAMLYQPYELTAYAYGVTRAVLTKDIIEQLNKENAKLTDSI